jgi:hypothetical protein
MKLAITDFLTDTLEERFDVGVKIPLINSCKRGKGEGVQSLGNAQVVPPANVFLVWIIRP